MLTSRTAASGLRPRASSRAWVPSAASMHAMPKFSRAVRTRASTVGSSSATSTCVRAFKAAGGTTRRRWRKANTYNTQSAEQHAGSASKYEPGGEKDKEIQEWYYAWYN